ncbi:MAG: crossover junction endodeoxyribonuclease RuvC [Lentisphaerae bacterium GWF2_45_14]|nr:MAG: crossover junction endodeoxyribonuclease RuvC [Lentisphaerae bacterium GWF2_45_14]
MIIMGIDTAIRCTGYGVIDVQSVNKMSILDCGVIKNTQSMPHSECLRRLSCGIRQLAETFKPDVVSIEDAFSGRNVKTAMILSLARGAAIAALAEKHIPVYAYSPKTAKKAAVGFGGASKEQVASMAAALFNINITDIPLDSTDALALAICHANAASRPELSFLLPKPV